MGLSAVFISGERAIIETKRDLHVEKNKLSMLQYNEIYLQTEIDRAELIWEENRESFMKKTTKDRTDTIYQHQLYYTLHNWKNKLLKNQLDIEHCKMVIEITESKLATHLKTKKENEDAQ